MLMMRLGDLIDSLDVKVLGALEETDSRAGGLSVRICDVTEDSRTVMPGSLYVARKGEKSDGRTFIASAVRAGAAAILMEDAPDVGRFAEDGRRSGRTAGVGASGSVTMLVTPNLPRTLSFVGERFYGNPSSKLAVIGVTGTNGKTTTTYLIHQMLNSMGVRCGLIGTVVIDDGVEVAAASMTTPPALEVSRSLARMLEAGCRAAVLEVSSHSLHQQRVAAVEFDVGVFTNLTGDHLDYHKTMEAYADAKAMLFEMLPAFADGTHGVGKGGTAIVNGDDPASERMVRKCSARVWRTRVQRDGDSGGRSRGAVESWCIARVQSATRHGSEAALTGPWVGSLDKTGSATERGLPMIVPMVGGHNVMNALQAASAVAALLDGSVEKIAAGCREIPSASVLSREVLVALSKCGAPPGRLECITSPTDPITVFVDYAHTDDALKTVLRVLHDAMGTGHADGRREIAPREAGQSLAVVFGCGGDRDGTKRPRMGRIAAELADRVYITSDNPRTEDAGSIIRQIVAGMPGNTASSAVVEPDREQAIRRAVREARNGDVIIIAGKGHEDYQILPSGTVGGDGRAAGTVKRFFDDRIVAGEALRLRGITPKPPAGKSSGKIEIK